MREQTNTCGVKNILCMPIMPAEAALSGLGRSRKNTALRTAIEHDFVSMLIQNSLSRANNKWLIPVPYQVENGWVSR